jgi:LysM repeat protein
MKHLLLGFVLASLCILTSCKSSSGGSTVASSSADYPFDENGNYRPEFLASNGGGSEVVDLTKDNPRSPFLGTTGPDAWASNNRTSSTASKPRSTSTSSSRSKTYSKPTSKTSSKKTVTKAPAKKSAPKYTTVLIKKGDTLSAYSRKYGVSVKAIQAANGMGSSTNIRDGKSIKIPSK